MKQKWREMSEQVKHGSGLDPEDDPSWYRIQNPLFSETNEDIVLTSKNADLSFKGDFRNYESRMKRAITRQVKMTRIQINRKTRSKEKMTKKTKMEKRRG